MQTVCQMRHMINNRLNIIIMVSKQAEPLQEAERPEQQQEETG